MTKRILIIFLTAFSYVNSNAQIDKLKNEIDSLLKDKNATVGVSIIANNLRDTININGNLHLPMQSIFKIPIALAVLSEVDKGRFNLNQKIKITLKDLELSNDLMLNRGPIKDKFPNGTTMTLGEIIKYTVSQSDNNGCDILLRLIGGTTVVEKFLLQNQLSDISVKASEGDMHKDWNIQFQNWATPIALNQLLIKFYVSGKDRILSEKSYQFLWKAMKETSTGMNRIKGQLPQGTIVAHKTGASGSIDKIVTPATNDIGIIFLSNGNPIFISVLVSDSYEDYETNEKIISDIAKMTWDYYSEVYKSKALIINQISRHVYQHISFLDVKGFGKVQCNGMIVTCKDEAVIFDTPIDDESSRELIDWVAKTLKCKIKAVIPTHYHIDNLGGLNEFHREGIASYAYNKTIQIAKEKGLPVPQHGFDKYLNLKVGNEKVHIEFFGEGHTCDNVVGYFPSENIMFGGCLIKEVGAGKGNLKESNVKEWSETVKRVKEKYPKVKTVIPGHGQTGGIELLDYTINLFK